MSPLLKWTQCQRSLMDFVHQAFCNDRNTFCKIIHHIILYYGRIIQKLSQSGNSFLTFYQKERKFSKSNREI